MTADATLRSVLAASRSIAVVGLSADQDRPSHGVAQYLKAHGFRVIPVNPRYPEILGERCYGNLSSVPDRVDIVDVFRKPAECAAVAEQAVAIGAKVLWLQLGIVNEDARRIAATAGLIVIMDRCIEIEHSRLCPERGRPVDESAKLS